MYKCRCGKEFDNKKSFIGHRGRCQIHIGWINSILTIDFLWDEYIEKEKSLPELEEQTGISARTIYNRLKKLNLNRSVKESCHVGNKEKKRRNTCMKRYGSPHNFCRNHPSRKKWEAELKEKEGIVNVFQREEVKQKIKSTLLEKYGVESSACITSSRGKNSYSKIHRSVVKALKKENININIEKKLPKENGYYYSFDIVVEPDILIEVNGDYWHGNPAIYKPTDIILKGSSRDCTVQEKWDYDAIKLQVAKDHGYKVIIIWESDWQNNKGKEIQRIKDEISKNYKN